MGGGDGRCCCTHASGVLWGLAAQLASATRMGRPAGSAAIRENRLAYGSGPAPMPCRKHTPSASPPPSTLSVRPCPGEGGGGLVPGRYQCRTSAESAQEEAAAAVRGACQSPHAPPRPPPPPPSHQLACQGVAQAAEAVRPQHERRCDGTGDPVCQHVRKERPMLPLQAERVTPSLRHLTHHPE